MSMTPDSWNSSHRSLPSRVRSPTPPNTETPPCFSASAPHGEGRRQDLGQAAGDERLDADRRGAARPRFPRRHDQGDPATCPHREPARASRGGAEEPDRLPDGRQRRGGCRLSSEATPSMLEPEVETRAAGRPVQARRRSIAGRSPICCERSPFYREKLAAAGFRPPRRSAAWTGSPACPSPRRPKSARAAARTDPIGTHLAVPRARLVRIYSTSGTTGTPSYIPLTSSDLDNWVTTSARSYAASGHRRRRGDRVDLQCRARSSPAPRSPPSTGSACAISRSAPATPSG